MTILENIYYSTRQRGSKKRYKLALIKWFVPAILNTTSPSSLLNNIVDPDWGGRDNGGITGLQWYETLWRHSLLVNAVESDFHKMAS